jgi:transglutaminase-like putative cysteine protease
MPRFIIHHVTKYTYAEPVRDSANQIMLFPLHDQYQELMSQQLVITGYPNIERYIDYYGNETGTFMYLDAHSELLIDSKIEIVTKPRLMPVVDIAIDKQWEYLEQIKYIVPFIDFLKQETFHSITEVKEITDPQFCKKYSVFEAAERLNEYVFQNFQYIKGVTNTETTVDEIWKLKAGVCQDFAHVLLLMLRNINIPARYVSGYVCPLDKDLRGEGATHAWVEAYIPFYGWLGLDPTNNCVVNDLHVRLAIGRSFMDCSPVKGTYKGTAKQVLEVGVSVSYEDGIAPMKLNTTLKAQPQPLTANLNNNNPTSNSYRLHVEMQKQQQQQQQQ